MDDEMTERGFVTWHSSDEDSGPDVGISIGLGRDRGMIWIGEVTRDRWEQGGEEVATLGADDGWWLMVYPEKGPPEIVGRFISTEAARDFADTLASLATVQP